MKKSPSRSDREKACVAILINFKIDFELKQSGEREEKKHAILIKGIENQENIITLNMYTPNYGIPNLIRSIRTTGIKHRLIPTQ